jgi:hypothetical protein
LRLCDEDFWNMPLGLFLDLWACHKQFLGWEKPLKIVSVDDIIPL